MINIRLVKNILLIYSQTRHILLQLIMDYTNGKPHGFKPMSHYSVTIFFSLILLF